MDIYVENEVYEFVLWAEIWIETTEELYTNKCIFYACLVCSKENIIWIKGHGYNF